MNVNLNSKTGAKEFHIILDTIKKSQMYSLPQFEQLCKDTSLELKRGYSVERSLGFLVKYYYLEWDALQVRRLASFVKLGHYKKALELYGV